jgi:hypothetical protein
VILRPGDRVSWVNNITGETQTGVLIWPFNLEGVIETTLEELAALEDSENVQEDVKKITSRRKKASGREWEIHDDNDNIYMIEEERLSRLS